jgi:hypothetical protein
MYGSVDAKSADSVVRADAGREIVSLTIADAVIVTLPLDEIDTWGDPCPALGFTTVNENLYMVPAAIVCPAATVSTSVPGTRVHAAVAPNTVVDPLPPTSAMLREPESAVCVPVSPLIVTVDESATVRPTLLAIVTVKVLVPPG